MIDSNRGTLKDKRISPGSVMKGFRYLLQLVPAPHLTMVTPFAVRGNPVVHSLPRTSTNQTNGGTSLLRFKPHGTYPACIALM